MPIKVMVLTAIAAGLLGLAVFILTLIWPGFRGVINRLPVLFGIVLVLASVFALVTGVIILTGQPWPDAVNVIEFSTFFALFSLGMTAINLAWFIAKSDKGGFNGVLGIAGTGVGLIALILTALPTVQMLSSGGAMEAEMRKVLGDDYASRIPDNLKSQLLAGTFSLNSFWDDFGVKDDKFVMVEDITYRTVGSEKLQMDVYHPPLATGSVSAFPTLMTIHGGGWNTGSKYEAGEFNKYMASKGWTVFAINYRLAPNAIYPEPESDIQCAMAYIAKNGSKYGADMNRFALLGRSAGGALALTAAYDPRPLPGVSECGQLPTVRSVVGLYPVTDLAEWYRTDKSGRGAPVVVGHLGGTPDQKPAEYKAVSPTTYAVNKVPPTLLIQSGKDQYNLDPQVPLLADKLKAAGNKVVTLKLDWAGHAFDFVFGGVSNQPALYYTERFLAYTVYNEVR